LHVSSPIAIIIYCIREQEFNGSCTAAAATAAAALRHLHCGCGICGPHVQTEAGLYGVFFVVFNKKFLEPRRIFGLHVTFEHSRNATTVTEVCGH
jgi:hypothetical protein